MAGRRLDRGLVYLRRSTGRQEASLGVQLRWAIEEAPRLGVRLDAAPGDLEAMQARRLSSYKDIRLDDGITGADPNRPGFLALMRDARGAETVSHLFVHRRDRLARPDDPFEMVSVERRLSRSGITIVFGDGVVEPQARGQGDLTVGLTSLLGYHEGGEFLRKLADRVLLAQRELARSGYRVGGNAPYGFCRALVDAKGKVLQELPPGRTARQPGCHVRIFPKDEEKLRVWLRILELRESGWGYKRIAQSLNSLRIPSPGAGTSRTDQGARHLVSGRWNPNTVKELCANRAILGLQDYGRRSEGAHRRLGPSGPRLLTDANVGPAERPKVVLNDPSLRITAALGTAPIVEAGLWERAEEVGRRRGSSQKGIPRAKDPSRYPLATRLVDLTDGCGSILYGQSNGGRALYKCGRYMRTAGAECESNSVDAEAMLRFTLRTLGQLVDRRGNRDRLRALLEGRARRQRAEPAAGPGLGEAALAAELSRLEGELKVVGRRMAKEGDDARYEAIAREYDRLRVEAGEAGSALEAARRSRPAAPATTVEDEVEAAMSRLDDIIRITSDAGARAEVGRLLRDLGLRIGLTFGGVVKGERRVVRRLLGGVMAFGDAPLPVPLHGAANREAIASASGPDPGAEALECEGDHDLDAPRRPSTAVDGFGRLEAGKRSSPGARVPSGTATRPVGCRPEGISITKESRDNKTPLELFLAGVQGWEAGLRRTLDCGTSSPC